MGEVQGYTEERLVLDRNGSAIPIETDSSLPSAFPADLPVRCPEQLKERSRVSTKNAVGPSGSTHPDVSIPPSISGCHCRINAMHCKDGMTTLETFDRDPPSFDMHPFWWSPLDPPHSCTHDGSPSRPWLRHNGPIEYLFQRQ